MTDPGAAWVVFSGLIEISRFVPEFINVIVFPDLTNFDILLPYVAGGLESRLNLIFLINTQPFAAGVFAAELKFK